MTLGLTNEYLLGHIQKLILYVKQYILFVKSHFVDLHIEQYCDIAMRIHKDLFLKDVTDKCLVSLSMNGKLISTKPQVYVVQLRIN